MDHTIVIFGASGDLTSRKLIPALYELHRKQRLPAGTRIVGSSRTGFSHQAWRDRLAASTAQYLSQRFDRSVWDDFASSVYYHAGDVTQPEDVASLGQFLDQLESHAQTTRLYYLSTAPQFYEPVVVNLGLAGMTCEDCAERRVIIEKPFGTDLASARRLNEIVHQVFAESQIYRIDHYLGKETVSNLLVLRFANTIFEPICRLVLQIQPAEGIQLHFQSKVPDAGMQRQLVDLDFNFRGRFASELPEAYQRLLLDAMLGDASLFARSDEVEASWRLIDPIQTAWDTTNEPPLAVYEPGNWGPVDSTPWMQQQGRQWFDSCPLLT